MSAGNIMRGQVFWCDLGRGRKPWLVVSNNQRNQNLDTVIAARITTGKNAYIETVIALDKSDPLTGFVLVDDLAQFFHDETTDMAGAVAPQTMSKVSAALRIALP